MIVYHGTTDRRARQICEVGFLPKKPSRRVWFAQSQCYARGRAKVKARRARCRPVVLTCDIDLAQLRTKLGRKRVFAKNGVIAIDGPVPVTVLRSHPSMEQPRSPEELAAWVNDRLGLKPWKGVGKRHPGIQRLSRWVVNRASTKPRGKISPNELLEMASRWLPEFFQGVEIDRQRLQALPTMKTIDVEATTDLLEPDPKEAEALDCLTDSRPKRRVRGLTLLGQVGTSDLSDWCAMFANDESVDVRVAALRTMVQCDDADPEVILPFARSEDKRVRGAAIAALAKHSGKDGPGWFERGLKDPSACVRTQTAAVLEELDAVQHRKVFELALYDPNPEVERLARKLTAGKGFAKPKW
jgi:hypothetical protein